jgi:S1-C subfamily serine protease
VRANESGFTERTTTKLSPAPASTPSPAHNGLLIAAIIAAMLVGAFGGVFVSRRIQRGDPNYPEIYEANRQSVVFVRIEFELLDSSGQSISTETRTGSGFIVSADGLIATNRHLLRDWEYDAASAGLNGRLTRVDVVLTGYVVEEALPAEVVKLSGTKEVDVALLKIDAPVAIEPVRMPDYDSTRVNPGDRVAVMGYPLGLDPLQRSNDSILEPALTPGAVARVSRESIQLNVRASRGNSGGPVLTRSGEVIGLVTANLSDGNIALCTPISAVVELMK